jgi:hypothetical protein
MMRTDGECYLAFVSASCLIIGLCLSGCTPKTAAENGKQPSPYGVGTDANTYTITNVTTLRTSDGHNLGDVYTFEHEGHLYVQKHSQGFIHSPACPCLHPVSEIKIEDEE